MANGEPRLYGELTEWYRFVDPPEDHADEAALFRQLLDGATSVRTVLELGSGGGNNASHLKAHYEMTLVDPSEGMLEVSRRLNPECRHVAGDMRTLRLEERFDAVFVHDAVDYMTSLEDLRAAMETAHAHLRPGGVALFAPDHLRDTFAARTEHGGGDEGDRGLRFLEWTWDPDASDSTYLADYAYLLREGADVRVEHDRHTCGLFARDEWLAALREAGFERTEVVPGPEGTEVFLAWTA